jgi:hypothetical protein
MDVSDFIKRARSALGRGVPYRQGTVSDFTSAMPPASGLDCGTFIRWAAKLELPEGRWDTTGIVHEAIGGQNYFKKIAAPYPGCVIVYPDYKAVAQVTRDETTHDGHVGIVTETGLVKIDTATGTKTFFGVTRVIHCSRVVDGLRAELLPGAGHDSIAETNALVFYTFVPIYASVWGIRADPVQPAHRD